MPHQMKPFPPLQQRSSSWNHTSLNHNASLPLKFSNLSAPFNVCITTPNLPPPPANATAQKIAASIANLSSQSSLQTRRWAELSARAQSSGVARPQTSSRPNLRYSDHNEAWRRCFDRGHQLWHDLTLAVTPPLHDTPVIDTSRWHQDCNFALPSGNIDRAFLDPNGLLTRVWRTRGWPDPEIPCWRANIFLYNPDEALQVDYIDWDATLTVNFMYRGLFPDADVKEEFTPETWADLIFWWLVTLAQRNNWKFNELDQVLFAELTEEEELGVIEDIWSHDRSLLARNGVSPIASFTPSDDNFYALLGTFPGNCVARLLTQYPYSFAGAWSRSHWNEDLDQDIIREIRTIANIQIAGSTVPRDHIQGATNNVDLTTKTFGFDICFILSDDDVPSHGPPESGQPTTNQPGPSQSGSVD